jgi:hypothetical protein
MFFAACSDAGPDACVFHESSSDAVKTRLSNIFAVLKNRPLPVYAQTNAVGASTEYGPVDYASARGLSSSGYTARTAPGRTRVRSRARWPLPNAATVARSGHDEGRARR